LPQRPLALDRTSGIGALCGDGLVERHAGQRRNLLLRQLVGRPADKMLPPGAFEPEVLLLAAQQRLVVVGRTERDLDFGATGEIADILFRDPSPKPVVLASWVLPRLEHFQTHLCGHLCVPPGCIDEPYFIDTI